MHKRNEEKVRNPPIRKKHNKEANIYSGTFASYEEDKRLHATQKFTGKHMTKFVSDVNLMWQLK